MCAVVIVPCGVTLLCADFFYRDAVAFDHTTACCWADLGFHDTQVHNPESPSPAIGGLAKEGIILQRHYVYMVSRGPQPLAAPCLSDLAALRLTPAFRAGTAGRSRVVSPIRPPRCPGTLLIRD